MVMLYKILCGLLVLFAVVGAIVLQQKVSPAVFEATVYSMTPVVLIALVIMVAFTWIMAKIEELQQRLNSLATRGDMQSTLDSVKKSIQS